jgi:ferredoxin
MIANYGYEDGSGFYYITVDGDLCAKCEHHGCVTACPGHVYAIEMDDYDDFVAVVTGDARKRLRELCSLCKGQNGGGGSEHKLPCTSACLAGALRHSW